MRFSPTCSSQSQGSVERAHRTLFGQIRTLRAQINRTTTERPTHVMQYNSQRLHSQQICHAQQRMHKLLQQVAEELTSSTRRIRRNSAVHGSDRHPKLQQRFFDGIWLGRDESAGGRGLDISNRGIRARTVRRTIAPNTYNQQMTDVFHAAPWHIPPPTAPITTRVARPQKRQEQTHHVSARKMLEQTQQPSISKHRSRKSPTK